MVKDTAFYELFASYKVPNHEQVGYWVDLKSNPRGEVIRVYNNNTRSWTKITEALPDIVNGSAFKSKREDGTYRETGLYDDPGDVSNILLELFEVINSNNAVTKITQSLYDKIKNLAKEHGTSSANSEVFIYDALTTTNLLSDVGGDCAIKIIYSKGEIHVYYNAYNAPYRTVEVVTLFDIDVNLHVKVQSIQNGVITEGIVSLLSSGDGTKYLNDAGEYETVNEVYVGSVEPTGNEEIWINPDEDYNLSSIGLVEEAPLDNKLHARKNGQWVEFVENNTDLSSFATKTDLETKVDEAPTDDKQYARKNGEWSEVTSGEVLDVTELSTLSTQTPDTEGLYTVSSELYNKVMSVDTMTCNKAVIGEGEQSMLYNILWYVTSDDVYTYRYLTLQSYGLYGEHFMAMPFVFTTEYPNKVIWDAERGIAIGHRSNGKGDKFLSDDGSYREVEGVYVGDTEPTGNQNVWIDPSDDSIDINAIPEAPVDGKSYVRKDSTWVDMQGQYENEELALILMDIPNRETMSLTQEEYDKFMRVCVEENKVYFAETEAMPELFNAGKSLMFNVTRSGNQIVAVSNNWYFSYLGNMSLSFIINDTLKVNAISGLGYVLPNDDGINIYTNMQDGESVAEGSISLSTSGDGTKFLSNSGEYSVPDRLENSNGIISMSNGFISISNTHASGYIQMTLANGDLISFTKEPNSSLRPAMNTNRISLGVANARWKELHVTDIYAYGNIYSNGKLILNSDTFTTEDLLTYGVKWEVNGTNPVLTRIGSDNLHRTLPIQSKMRGCTLADDGTVNHYFNNDWTANTDGTPIIKDGSDGMVMIEIPEHYVKYEVVDGYNTIRLSEIALAGYTKVDKQYISAYEATVDRTISKIKLASVVNNNIEFRGGTNNSLWDSGENTLLGKPLTSVSRANFRQYARNRGNENEYYWNMYDFIAHNTLYTFYIVEYANLNSQLAVNNTLTSNGYKQGGLGSGVTNLKDTTWQTFNGFNPVIPCGYSDSLGNNSGEVAYTMPASYGTLTTYVNRYRGIENPFGHIWKNVDGIIFDIKTDADGGTSTIYIATNPEKYKDSVDEGYTAIGELPRTDGYGKSLHLGTFFPSAVGGSATTGLCDYFYTDISSSSLRTCSMGGHSDNGAIAGLDYVNSHGLVGTAGSVIGSRLVFRK